MKKHYSIGETAKLIGISTQTLRYYDKIGLISPSYVSPETGYRYYTFDQFHYLDRIRYLQKLGMSLKEIDEVIGKGEVAPLVGFLEKKHAEAVEELKLLKERIREIEWYCDYFTYMADNPDTELYKASLDERYILQVPCYENDVLADMEIRLAGAKSSSRFKDYMFLRQYGYKMNFDSFLRGKFYPTHYFTYVKDMPDLDSPFFDVLPAGEYLCFRTRLLQEEWDVTIFEDLHLTPRAVVALEYEDNLKDYSKALYEVQILI